MKCPSCGVLIESGSNQCGQCSTVVGAEKTAAPGESTQSSAEPQTSKLIEFPGVSRSSVPQWRKELSERVREVQEKRAREDTFELSLEKKTGELEPSDAIPQLELLPQAELAPVNPLVTAALRRIERAHESGAYVSPSSNLARATAVAYAEPMDFHGEKQSPAPSVTSPRPTTADFEEPEPRQPEKTHNLVVVPLSAARRETTSKPKPRRMIAGDINDPALNYLDSIPTAVRVEAVGHQQASVLARFTSALLDLIVVSILCAPFAAALELININWQDPRVWIFAALVFSLVGFLYFTISTALTGRTLGLRLLSLRIVDARTGLIPTGTQSAGRALIYLASLLILGISSGFALLNSERLTAHDRITRTAVIHV